jgi:hypothetical protein
MNLKLELKATIARGEKDLLQEKGLMTARGMFERYMQQCFTELNLYYYKKKIDKFKACHAARR